jgi:hypothetical protein
MTMPPFMMNFMLDVPLASIPAVEMCCALRHVTCTRRARVLTWLMSLAGIIFSASVTL